jgi:hypothetical protein
VRASISPGPPVRPRSDQNHGGRESASTIAAAPTRKQSAQKAAWLSGPVGEFIGSHLRSLVEYPPVQSAKSFDRSNMVQDFLQSQKR